MLDTINLERKGIPAAVVGKDKLLNTTGKGMAKAQGYSSLSFAVFPYSHRAQGGAATEEEDKANAVVLVGQIEGILTGEVV